MFFADQQDFRAWLQKHHKTEAELWVGFYKVGSGKQGITWSQAVDQALCFGWIDGVRRSVDSISYTNRFTPRKASSNWSDINISKVAALTKAGLMQPAGLAAFEKRTEERSRIYSFESDAKVLKPDYQKRFKADQGAWKFFTTQAPSYQRTMIHWIMTAKQEATRLSRLERTIAASHQGERL